MLEQAGLSITYWKFAIEHASYIKNPIPHFVPDFSKFDKLTDINTLLSPLLRNPGQAFFLEEMIMEYTLLE